jgi:hypothetical protein
MKERKIFYHKIFPEGGKVIALICYEEIVRNVYGKILKFEEKISMSHKFGSEKNRGNYPSESDYIEAQKWVEDQTKFIVQYTSEGFEGRGYVKPSEDKKYLSEMVNLKKI